LEVKVKLWKTHYSYKRYYAILFKVILTAKKLHCNKYILSSRNKVKNTWEIIYEAQGKAKKMIDIQYLKTDNNKILNQNQIANIFNNYFFPIRNT
jgi:hypothetical protein